MFIIKAGETDIRYFARSMYVLEKFSSQEQF